MTARELVALVARMRAEQRAFFSTGSKSSLIESKRLERDVDRALVEFRAVAEAAEKERLASAIARARRRRLERKAARRAARQAAETVGVGRAPGESLADAEREPILYGEEFGPDFKRELEGK